MEVWVYDKARAEHERSPEFNSWHIRKEESMGKGVCPRKGRKGGKRKAEERAEREEGKEERYWWGLKTSNSCTMSYTRTLETIHVDLSKSVYTGESLHRDLNCKF